MLCMQNFFKSFEIWNCFQTPRARNQDEVNKTGGCSDSQLKRERHQAGANSETDQFQAQSTLTSFAEESKRQGARQMEMTPAGVLGAFVATLCASVVGAISPAEEDYLVHASFARHTYVSDNIK